MEPQEDLTAAGELATQPGCSAEHGSGSAPSLPSRSTVHRASSELLLSTVPHLSDELMRPLLTWFEQEFLPKIVAEVSRQWAQQGATQSTNSTRIHRLEQQVAATQQRAAAAEKSMADLQRKLEQLQSLLDLVKTGYDETLQIRETLRVLVDHLSDLSDLPSENSSAGGINDGIRA